MNNVISVLRITANDDGTLTTKETASGGVRGDNRALKLMFEDLPSAYRYQIEIVDGSGAYDVTLPLETKNGTLEYAVPAAWTAPGTAALRLVVIGAGEDPVIRHYGPLNMTFADREEGEAMGEMLPRWQTVMAESEGAAQKAKTAAASAENAATRAHAASQLKGVYIGSGEMPEGYTVQIDPNGEPFTMDNVLNPNSSNPVTNKAICDRFACKINSGNLCERALSLPDGIHAVVNTSTATPSTLVYTVSLVAKFSDSAGNVRCTVYGYTVYGLFVNTYDNVRGWNGWKVCQVTDAAVSNSAEG